MAEIYITSQRLAEVLKIAPEKLEEIENHFDSILDDEWELVEGKDYKIVQQSTGLREYTTSGAYAVAEYLEKTQQSRGILGIIRKFISILKGNIRKAFVKEKILNNCSSLVRRQNYFFISETDVVAIFGTNKAYLRKMGEAAKKNDQTILLENIDYADFIQEGVRFYSLSGIDKLSQVIAQHHTKKNRRDWCSDVGKVIQPQVSDIVDQIIKREKSIQSIKNSAKKRDKDTCQVTLQRKARIKKVQFAAHHLYSASQYPHLAASVENLITITTEVHDHFHQFMGGFDKPCTVDDFIKFVKHYYPENTQVVIWLEHQKKVLGNPQPSQPHVLYLPASKVC